MPDRIDKILPKLGLVSSRSQALDLIKEGFVYYKGVKVTKPGQRVVENFEYFEVKKEHLFVGRGAEKIKGPYEKFNLNVVGKIIADVGASTGGFSEFVLLNGSSKVYAIDVGHGQLAQKLVQDPRVVNLEGVNIRNSLTLDEKVDLAVVDLSYISLKLTLENIFNLVHEKGQVLALVKPQFEVGKEGVGKKGIVRDEKTRVDAVIGLYEWCGERGYFLQNVMVSPIKGKTGNIEYFFLLNRSLEGSLIGEQDIIKLEG